jgi:hypothetical protein
MTLFYCPIFETSPTWKAKSPYYIPQELDVPAIPPGTGLPFCRLLRLGDGGIQTILYTGFISTVSSIEYSPAANSTENMSSIVACSLVARESKCQQSSSLPTTVLYALSSIYTAVAW